MRHSLFLYSVFFATIICGSCSSKTTEKQIPKIPSTSVEVLLNRPLGTLVKLQVEVFDGDLTQQKQYEGEYLFKIKSIDNKQTTDTILMSFKDETGKFSTNDFELYKNLYGKDTGILSSTQVDKMKKEYVGKVFNIVAYETGEFSGIPDGYFDYQPIRADMPFHFKNYLVVISDLTKNN